MAIETMFTKSDLTHDGRRGSEYPAWYFTENIEELKDEAQRKESALANGYISDEDRPRVRQEVARINGRIDEIEGTTPRLSDADRDNLAKARKKLGEQISALMFKSSDVARGLADAHEEAKRMSEPCVIVGDDANTLAVVKACGVESISPSGKISRTAAEKVWQIASKFLGETTYTESLRSQK